MVCAQHKSTTRRRPGRPVGGGAGKPDRQAGFARKSCSLSCCFPRTRRLGRRPGRSTACRVCGDPFRARAKPGTEADLLRIAALSRSARTGPIWAIRVLPLRIAALSRSARTGRKQRASSRRLRIAALSRSARTPLGTDGLVLMLRIAALSRSARTAMRGEKQRLLLRIAALSRSARTEGRVIGRYTSLRIAALSRSARTALA